MADEPEDAFKPVIEDFMKSRCLSNRGKGKGEQTKKQTNLGRETVLR